MQTRRGPRLGACEPPPTVIAVYIFAPATCTYLSCARADGGRLLSKSTSKRRMRATMNARACAHTAPAAGGDHNCARRSITVPPSVWSVASYSVSCTPKLRHTRGHDHTRLCARSSLLVSIFRVKSSLPFLCPYNLYEHMSPTLAHNVCITNAWPIYSHNHNRGARSVPCCHRLSRRILGATVVPPL